MSMDKEEMKTIVSKNASKGKYADYGLKGSSATAADYDKDIVGDALDSDFSGENTEMVYAVNPINDDSFGEFAFKYKNRIMDLLEPVKPKTEDEVIQENIDPNSIG